MEAGEENSPGYQNLNSEFPSDEKFRLADQIIRSSRSIGNNLAEGHGRYHFQDNIKFCVFARGSLSETLDHMIIAKDDGIIDQEVFDNFKTDYDQCMKLLNGYILHLKDKKASML